METVRRLTHVELLHRPGERELAQRFFDLLGCESVDRGGHWFTALVDPAGERDFSNNVCYASEVGEEQWALERAMQASPAMDQYRQSLRHSPQKAAHFGLRVPTEAKLNEIVERVSAAGETDDLLAGRVAVDGVYRPQDPGAIAPNMVQAFVWTDIVAVGLLSLGQHVEIQWHLS
ncbi:MAG TPA: hypothetical protein VHX15_16935 [Frankiaceae bacterium]|jgi:hypothetical protein|nr:hypothetical protein [Frankiaceae bacterium]